MIENSPYMTIIKRQLPLIPRNWNHDTPSGMSQAHFIINIGISAAEICNNYFRAFYKFENVLRNICRSRDFVHTSTVIPKLSRRRSHRSIHWISIWRRIRGIERHHDSNPFTVNRRSGKLKNCSILYRIIVIPQVAEHPIWVSFKDHPTCSRATPSCCCKYAVQFYRRERRNH